MAELLLPGNVDKAKPFEDMLNKRIGQIKMYGEATKDLPLDLRQMGMLAIPGFFDAEKEPWEETQKKLGWYLGEQEKAALKRSEMNKEASGQALLMKSISQIGPSLATALGGPSWETLANRHSNNLTAINNINPSTLQPLSTAQFQSKNYYS
jgi:hypothetical protein